MLSFGLVLLWWGMCMKAQTNELRSATNNFLGKTSKVPNCTNYLDP